MSQPTQLRVYAITRDGMPLGDFFWDSRLNQLRKTDNPHEVQAVDDPLLGQLLDILPVGKGLFSVHVTMRRVS